MWYLIILLKVRTAYLAYPEGTSLIYIYIYIYIYMNFYLKIDFKIQTCLFT